MNRIASFSVIPFLLTATLSAGAAASAPITSGGPYQVFKEYFDQSQPGPQWTLFSQIPGVGFRWQQPGEQPGFHYYNNGQGFAYAPWNVGTQAFDLKFDVAVTTGMLHEWIRNGVFVALSTSAPDKQGPNDLSVVVALQGAGPAASVRKGQLFIKDTEISNISKWPTNGDIESVTWPNTDLVGTQLTVEMQRLPGNVLQFSIFRPDYKNGLQPWWTQTWTMPATLAGTAFQTLIVQTLNSDQTTNVPQAAYAYKGTVSNIRGYVPGTTAAPSVSSAALNGQNVFQSGATVTLNGQGFEAGATAWLNGQYLNTTYISATQVSITLPALPPGSYRVKVINPSGLEGEIAAGISYSGPLVSSVEPREASPAGGDLVTVVGAGFDSRTQVTIGGLPAPVMQVVDAFHLLVQTPGGASGSAVVQVKGANGVYPGSPQFGYAPHPYMYYPASGLAGLQQKFANPQFADYRTIMLRNANDADPNNPKGAMADYLWPYLLTGSSRYRTSLFVKISQELDRLDFTDFRLSDAALMATAYDTLFSELTAPQRTAFLSYLDRAYAVYNQMRVTNAWFLGPSGGNVSNTIAVGNSGGGQVAVALQYSTPGATVAITDAVKRILPFALNSISADGGAVEGPLYWSYGLTWYLQFGHVLQNATGDDRTLLSQANLAKNYRFIETTLGSDGYLGTFNDSEPQLYGMAVTADLGTRQSQPLMLWMSDNLAHRAADASQVEDEASRYDIVPYAFLWRGNALAPKTFPGLPTSSVLQNMNWGVLRSTPDLQPYLFAGIKGAAGQITHHAQNDLGSFILQAGGEDFFIDPGYYQAGANAHTLPVIDGAVPLTLGSTIDSLYDTNGVRSMAVDSTVAYAGKAQRVRRIVTMYADQATVVLDDIVPAAGQPGRIVNQFQTGFPTSSIAGPGILIQGLQNQVRTAFNGPAAQVAVTGPNNFGSSWVYKAKNVQWYSSNVSYTADANKPMVGVIVPSAAGKNPVSATVAYSTGQITVTFNDGRILTFTLGVGGWKLGGSSSQTPVPTVSGISPSSIAAGSTANITVTGANFAPGSSLSVTGAGVTASNVVVVSATQVTATLGVAATAGTGARTLTVGTSASSSGPGVFNVTLGTPALTAISPSSGARGATIPVTLSGTNFVPGAAVTVSGAGVTASNIVVVSSSQITATVTVAPTASASAVNFSVATPGGNSGAMAFGVSGPIAPGLTSLGTATGSQGTNVPVILTGSNFAAGATVMVSGSGVSVTNTVFMSATQITATLTIASTATPGAYNVSVKTGTGTSNALPFTVAGAGYPRGWQLRFEAETLPVAASSQPVQKLVAAGFSSGLGTLLNATQIGDSVTYTVNVPKSGAFRVQLNTQTLSSYGSFKLTVNGVSTGVTVDEYYGPGGVYLADLGNVTIASPGNSTFQVTVTGKNPLSSGLAVSLDFILLTAL